MPSNNAFNFRTEIINHSENMVFSEVFYEILSIPLKKYENQTIDEYFTNLSPKETNDLINETFEFIKCFMNKNISVNVNKTMLENDNLISDIYTKMAKLSRTNNLKFAIEVSENCCEIVFNESFKKHINKIKDFGIKLWLDDFGTGQSNFTSVLSGVFDTIKIDKSIFWDLYSHCQPLLVEIINYFNNSLNYQIIIEGVEEEDQLNFAYRNNCLAQGFIFRK